MNLRRILLRWTVPLAAGVALAAPLRAATVLNLVGDLGAYPFAGGASPVPSQRYPDFPAHDCVVIEDFTVTAAGLRLSAVSVLFFAQRGFDSFGRVEGYGLDIFSAPERAAQDLAGDVVHLLLPPSAASLTRVVDPQTGDEYGLVSFVVDQRLPSAGVYWIGISPRASFTAGGDFRVAAANTAGLTNTGGEDNATWGNPGQGFGGPAGSPLGAGFAYAVTVVPEPSAALLSLTALAAWACRRRRELSRPFSARSGAGCADSTSWLSKFLEAPPLPAAGLDRWGGSFRFQEIVPAPSRTARRSVPASGFRSSGGF